MPLEKKAFTKKLYCVFNFLAIFREINFYNDD